MNVYLDLETIPDQTPNAVEVIMEEIEVKAPSLTKPKLIELLKLDASSAKYKSVDELKDIWLERHGEEAKKEQAIEKWLKTSFDGGKGEICCIGYACHNMKSGYQITGTEKEILEEFNNHMADRLGSRIDGSLKEVYFICHNAKFDLPFLHKRFVVNGIKPQFKCNFNGRHGQHHFCTMEEWAGFNGRISQDNL